MHFSKCYNSKNMSLNKPIHIRSIYIERFITQCQSCNILIQSLLYLIMVLNAFKILFSHYYIYVQKKSPTLSYETPTLTHDTTSRILEIVLTSLFRKILATHHCSTLIIKTIHKIYNLKTFQCIVSLREYMTSIKEN